MTNIAGAQALIKALEYEGVDIVFGVPGGAMIPTYDHLYDSSLRHVLTRHEQGAGHMAEGYAWATGKVGVCMATSGPGATNLVTALANAQLDSVPIVAITGQVPQKAIGNDAFQEVDITGITAACTKHNFFVTSADDIPDIVHEAFHIASSGRPGPVLIDFPKDVQQATTKWHDPVDLAMPGYKPTVEGHPLRIKDAVALIQKAKRPVLYVGGGIIKANASEELAAFARLCNAPVTTTLMGRGAFPDSHPLHMGMPGMHGTYTATTAIQKSDLLIAIGVRFDDRVTSHVPSFAPHAKVIHVDVDPAEIGKVRTPDVPIVGDAKVVLRQLIEAWGDSPSPDLTQWLDSIKRWKTTYPLSYEQPEDGPIKPQFAIQELHRITKGDTILVSGVGQHQMWASQFWQFEKPRRWVNSGGLATMGYGIPAAIGAKAGKPDEMVYLIDGDGSFQMTMQELTTAALEGFPIKILLLNNSSLGMVRQWQKMFYKGRYSATDLGILPDFVMLMEAMGGIGIRVTAPEEVAPAIEKSLTIDDRPCVVEAMVDINEDVYPMVASGTSNDDVIIGPDQFADPKVGEI